MRLVELIRAAACILLLSLVAACGPMMAGYSLEAYQNATTLKAETLAIVAESDEPFAEHEQDVRILKTKLDAAYEFSAGITYNRLSAVQWKILNTEILAGFISTWRAQGTTSEVYRREGAALIAEGFDEIICLEVNKQQRKRCEKQEVAR